MGDEPTRQPDEGDIGPASGTPGGDSAPGATSAPTSSPGAANAPASAPGAASGPAAARRGPGRPPKASSSKAGGGDGKPGQSGPEAVRLRVDQAAKPPKRDIPSKPKAAAPGDAGNPQATATMILQLAELAAMATIGPSAKLNMMERGLIEPSMVRILARMDAAAVARYSALSDPILLGLGLSMYGFRLWASARAAAAQSDQAGDRAPAAGGAAGAAVSTPAPVAVAGPPPAETPAQRAAARNGVAPVPADIHAHIAPLGGYEG